GDASVDVFLGLSMLDSFLWEDLCLLMREIARVLKPGGKFLYGADLGPNMTTEVARLKPQGRVPFMYYDKSPGQVKTTDVRKVEVVTTTVDRPALVETTVDPEANVFFSILGHFIPARNPDLHAGAHIIQVSVEKLVATKPGTVVSFLGAGQPGATWRLAAVGS